MIDLYYSTTPNAHKITMFLEEAALPYRIIPVNIDAAEQVAPISSNKRIPAIVDHSPIYGCLPLSLFESGAILLYLADKIGSFMPHDLRGRMETLQWVFGQGNKVGQMAGQDSHFIQREQGKMTNPAKRYCREIARAFTVLDKHLAKREFIANGYSIADIASYPWIVPCAHQGRKLENYPNLNRWFQTVRSRPATQRAYAMAQDIDKDTIPTEE